jgi:hypothetical protein
MAIREPAHTGFEFLNEAASDEQKHIIINLSKQLKMPIDEHVQWPTPFSKWDALNMIAILEEFEEQIKKRDVHTTLYEAIKSFCQRHATLLERIKHYCKDK